MTDVPLSRRQALSTLGGAALAGMAGLPAACPPLAAVETLSESLIDVHIHVVGSRLPRSNDKDASAEDVRENPQRTAKTISQELKQAGVQQALCMPRAEISDQDPLGIKGTLAVAQLVEDVKLHPVGLAHPERFDRDHLARVEEVLKQGQVKALKAYLGYLHYGPDNAGYRPYFRLAAKYKIPIIFHTGDTYSRIAKVKFAHPLAIDEIAVDFPDTRFVLAHFGNPWLLDAAQVVYKNKNVWIDLSAILIGDADEFAALRKDGVWARTATRVKEAIEYAEAPDRFMFGSDWPLSPIAAYRDFVRDLFPEQHHAAVFRDNAKALLGL